MQPLAPTAPPPPVAIPGPGGSNKGRPARRRRRPTSRPRPVTPEPSPASPPAPAPRRRPRARRRAARAARQGAAYNTAGRRARRCTRRGQAPAAASNRTHERPRRRFGCRRARGLDGYQAHEVSRTDDSLSSDTTPYGIIACSEPPRDRRRPGLGRRRAAAAAALPGMVRGGPRRRAASSRRRPPRSRKPPQRGHVQRRPSHLRQSSGTNGAIAIIGAKRMRVIVRDGNGVPIEPPATGGRGLDDSPLRLVDERCLDGLLPHGGGARVDPYRARDA